MSKEDKLFIFAVTTPFWAGALMLGVVHLLMKYGVMSTKVYYDHQLIQMEFVRVDSPPTHFYCTFIDKDRPATYERMFVSKHFNEWRNLVPHTTFYTTRCKKKWKGMFVKDDGSFHYEYPNLYDDLKNIAK